jgi:hypothetical protein
MRLIERSSELRSSGVQLGTSQMGIQVPPEREPLVIKPLAKVKD